MTFISTERLNDSVFPNFERDMRRRYYLIVSRIKKTHSISSTIIYNIIEDARKTFTDCTFKVNFRAKNK
jgi:hypothetical protein